MFFCWNNCSTFANVKLPSLLVKLPTNKRIDGRIRKRIANKKNGITPSHFFQSNEIGVIFFGVERVVCVIFLTTSSYTIGVRPRQMAGSHNNEQTELRYGAAFTSAPTVLSQLVVMSVLAALSCSAVGKTAPETSGSLSASSAGMTPRSRMSASRIGWQ